jgi:probable phosphoglycerate mutase
MVVAHNAVNQALIASALGLPPRYFRRLLQVRLLLLLLLLLLLMLMLMLPHACLNTHRLLQGPVAPHLHILNARLPPVAWQL